MTLIHNRHAYNILRAYKSVVDQGRDRQSYVQSGSSVPFDHWQFTPLEGATALASMTRLKGESSWWLGAARKGVLLDAFVVLRSRSLARYKDS